MADVLKTCRCGADYDREAWRRLPLCGYQDFEDGTIFELRHCRCGSTISVRVEAADVVPGAPRAPV